MSDVAFSGYATVAIQILTEVVANAVGKEIHTDYDKKIEKIQRLLVKLQTAVDDMEKYTFPDTALLTLSKNLKEVVQDFEDFLVSIDSKPGRIGFIRKLFSAHDTDTLNKRLDELSRELNDMYSRETLKRSWLSREERVVITSSFLQGGPILGRERDTNEIIQMLIKDTNATSCFDIISMVGTIGIGKTTLAQIIYNNHMIAEHFEKRVWLSMPTTFDLRLLTKAILESFCNRSVNMGELDTLQKQLASEVSEKFLLVIDGAWNGSHSDWERLFAPLRGGKRGSKILVTTQSQTVSMVMGASECYCLGRLSKGDFWTLFKQEAFRYKSEQQELMDMARVAFTDGEPLEDGMGYPLFAKTLGRILGSCNPTEWREVLDGKVFELSKKNDEIFSRLQLAGYHMPAQIRHCLSFCSLYPFGHKFQRDKLIYMWKAAGYIHSKGDKRYEDIGDEIIDQLLNMSLLQLVDFSDNSSFFLPPAIYTLANHVSSDDYLGLTDSKMLHLRHVSRSFRHAVILNPQADIDLIRKFKKLRTFLALGNLERTEQIDDSFFEKFQLLRLLDLNRAQVDDIPNRIERLKFLEFIDLSGTNIKELPVAITSLLNLEALIFENCEKLTKLPEKIYNLVQLSCLGIDVNSKLQSMPDLSRFPNLRTLGTFIVYRSEDNMLDMLGNLKKLRGTLGISRLENVLSEEAAKRALLKEKKDVRKLHLHWSTTSELGAEQPDQSLILQVLEPHANLRELQISGYCGLNFPSWIRDQSCCNLVSIKFYRCDHCLSLPDLKKLPSLRILSLDGLNLLEELDLGLITDPSVTVGFPILDSILVKNMPKLRSWKGPTEGYCRKLREISICHCPRLTALPNFELFISLQLLSIERCLGLENLPDLPRTLNSLTLIKCGNLDVKHREGGDRRHKIEHIPNISVD